MVVASVDAVVLTPVYECSPSFTQSCLMLYFWSHIYEMYPLGVLGNICVWEPLLPSRKEFFENKPTPNELGREPLRWRRESDVVDFCKATLTWKMGFCKIPL